MAIYVLFEQHDRVIGGGHLQTNIPIGYCNVSEKGGRKLPTIERPKVEIGETGPNIHQGALLSKAFYFVELEELPKDHLAKYLPKNS